MNGRWWNKVNERKKRKREKKTANWDLTKNLFESWENIFLQPSWKLCLSKRSERNNKKKWKKIKPNWSSWCNKFSHIYTQEKTMKRKISNLTKWSENNKKKKQQQKQREKKRLHLVHFIVMNLFFLFFFCFSSHWIGIKCKIKVHFSNSTR